jgi:hypothetical protein
MNKDKKKTKKRGRVKLRGLKMFTLLGRPYFYGLEKSLKKFDKFLTFWD